jgi:hypothetical protein
MCWRCSQHTMQKSAGIAIFAPSRLLPILTVFSSEVVGHI